MDEQIRQHLEKYDLDIRKKPQGYSRYMDQKVTPDVLSFIADCILNLVGSDTGRSFTVKDIWESSYFEKNTRAIFGKPSPSNDTARSEYNKFIGQPLKTLAFAKVLTEEQVGRTNTYTINDFNILQYVSAKERNAYLFLYKYLTKVMSDSGFISSVEEYMQKCRSGAASEDDFQELKKRFQRFMKGHTEIEGDVEINRIFPKVLNPIAAENEVPGTEKGHMTRYKFIYQDLMYNRLNFRDLGKSKEQSRQEAFLVRDADASPVEYQKYRVQRAMNLIQRKYTQSEVRDSLGGDVATQVHHIFPRSRFPELADYLENLIKLTPQQHNTRAHPNNKTQEVNPEYQLTCLLAKMDSIEQSLRQGEFIYSKESLVHVVNAGLGLSLNSSATFDEIRVEIKKAYQ